MQKKKKRYPKERGEGRRSWHGETAEIDAVVGRTKRPGESTKSVGRYGRNILLVRNRNFTRSKKKKGGAPVVSMTERPNSRGKYDTQKNKNKIRGKRVLVEVL